MTNWPENKRFAVTLSFDLDAESGWEPSSLSGRRLSLLSMGAYSSNVSAGEATFSIPAIRTMVDDRPAPSCA